MSSYRPIYFFFIYAREGRRTPPEKNLNTALLNANCLQMIQKKQWPHNSPTLNPFADILSGERYTELFLRALSEVKNSFGIKSRTGEDVGRASRCFVSIGVWTLLLSENAYQRLDRNRMSAASARQGLLGKMWTTVQRWYGMWSSRHFLVEAGIRGTWAKRGGRTVRRVWWGNNAACDWCRR